MNFVISAEFGMIELMNCVEIVYQLLSFYFSKCQRGVPRTYYKDYNTISV
jgi:hypothetical protein